MRAAQAVIAIHTHTYLAAAPMARVDHTRTTVKTKRKKKTVSQSVRPFVIVVRIQPS